MKKVLVVALLLAGLGCEMPAGDVSPTPTPTPTANPTPTPDATPIPNATPNPLPTPTPGPTDDPTQPTPTPDPNDTTTNGIDDEDLGCLDDEILVVVSDVCDLDGSNLGCCPRGFPKVSDDCFCLPDDGTTTGPTPTPQPTPPPFNCNDGEVLVRLPEGCEIDETGFACCPEDLPSIDVGCFCVEFIPPE